MSFAVLLFQVPYSIEEMVGGHSDHNLVLGMLPGHEYCVGQQTPKSFEPALSHLAGRSLHFASEVDKKAQNPQKDWNMFSFFECYHC